MPLILSVVSQKGGVGKSTICRAVAREFANIGWAVKIADLDISQATNFLLMDTLHRSWRATSEVAYVGVVVEALDKTARSFYLHHDFVPLQDHPNKLFLAMATIEKAFKMR